VSEVCDQINASLKALKIGWWSGLSLTDGHPYQFCYAIEQSLDWS
jgi:hypothetical protein